MKTYLMVLLTLLTAGLASAEREILSLNVADTCVGEGFIDPLGFHDATPTFSWQPPTGVKKQTAYHIEVKDQSSLAVLLTRLIVCH